MKSRLTILAMLVAGILLSTTGAGLAVSGLSSSGDAGESQYGTPAPSTTPAGNVLGEEQSGGGNDTAPTSQAAPAATEAAPAATEAAQPAAQVSAGTESGSLPFSGFAALPVLLGGVVLLGGGLVLRHRTRGERS